MCLSTSVIPMEKVKIILSDASEKGGMSQDVSLGQNKFGCVRNHNITMNWCVYMYMWDKDTYGMSWLRWDA